MTSKYNHKKTLSQPSTQLLEVIPQTKDQKSKFLKHQQSAKMSHPSLSVEGAEQKTVTPIDKVLSDKLLNDVIYACIEAYKKDIFSYARKEILYNESFKVGSSYPSNDSEFDALYSLDRLTMFNTSPSYQQVYLLELNDLITKISSKINVSVTELVTVLLEQAQARNQALLQQQMAGSQGGRLGTNGSSFKYSYSREIPNQSVQAIFQDLKKFQSKFEESRMLLNSMRKHFLKEISHLRAVEDIQFQNKGLKGIQIKPQTDINTMMEVYYFSPTEGLDEDTCKIFNNYLAKLRNEFQGRLAVLNDLNKELLRKVALIDESKKVSEMNSEELVELTFAKEKDQLVIWQQLKKKFSQETLEKIAEEEFSDLISNITEREITTQVEKITQESKYQIQDAKEKLQKELNYLRLQISYKSEEIDKLKESKLFEIDKARIEGYDKAEKRFFENLKNKEQKFNDERQEWERKMETVTMDDNKKYLQLQMGTYMMKWRFMMTVAKMKNGGGTSTETDTVEDILSKVMDSQVKKYQVKIEQLEKQASDKDQESNNLKNELDKLKQLNLKHEDKIDLLLTELSNTQDENIEHKREIDQINQTMRALQSDTEQLQRTVNINKELIFNLEMEKDELEKKLSATPKTHAVESPHMSQLGQSSMNLLQGGIGSPRSGGQNTTANQNNLGTFMSSKFNSKLFAQKTLQNMIGDRQGVMGDIYANNQCNMAIDTADLIEFSNARTQYKTEHFANEFNDDNTRNITTMESQKFLEIAIQTDIVGTDQNINNNFFIGNVSDLSFNQQMNNNIIYQNNATSQANGQGGKITDQQHQKEAHLSNARNVQTATQKDANSQSYMDDGGQTSMMNGEESQRLLGNQYGDTNGGSGKFRRRGKSQMTNQQQAKSQNAQQQHRANNRSYNGGIRGDQDTFNEDDFDNCDLGLLTKNSNIRMNDEIFKRALQYASNKDAKRDAKKGYYQQQSIQLLESMPQVHRRLWDNVEQKFKKAQQLTNQVNQSRALQWAKLLHSNNLLNKNDPKSQEIINFIESSQLLSQQQQLAANDKLDKSNIGFHQLQQIQMSRVMDILDMEQEKQYQDAIQKWQEQKNIKQHFQPIRAQSQQSVYKQSGVNQSADLELSSVYITEQPYQQHETSKLSYQKNNFSNAQQVHKQGQDKEIQTDAYLLENYMQQKIPLYQAKLNQFLQNKQQNYNNYNSQQLNYSKNQDTYTGSDYNNAGSQKQVPLQIGQNPRLGLINSANQQSRLTLKQANEKKKLIFMNSKIRQLAKTRAQTSTSSPKGEKANGHGTNTEYGTRSNSSKFMSVNSLNNSSINNSMNASRRMVVEAQNNNMNSNYPIEQKIAGQYMNKYTNGPIMQQQKHVVFNQNVSHMSDKNLQTFHTNKPDYGSSNTNSYIISSNISQQPSSHDINQNFHYDANQGQNNVANQYNSNQQQYNESDQLQQHQQQRQPQYDYDDENEYDEMEQRDLFGASDDITQGGGGGGGDGAGDRQEEEQFNMPRLPTVIVAPHHSNQQHQHQQLYQQNDSYDE